MARRASGRHGRSIPRFTPRRWLPFLVLSAVVVGGIVVAAEDDPQGRADEAPATTTAIVPSVSQEGALSSAAFCGGGTARGEDGPAEMTLVIANDDDRGATADITVHDLEGGHATKSVKVPANGRARVQAASIRAGEWVAATVEVRGGRTVVDREVRGKLGIDVSACATTAAETWYVPSGSTLRGSEEYLSIYNPFPDSSSVDVSFATETGRRAPRSLRGLSVPGGSLRIVRVADSVTNRAQIAATVQTRSGRVVVDRVQLHDGEGDDVTGPGDDPVTTDAPIGLVSTSGFAGASPRWFFPGTSITAGARSQVAVYNPNDEEVDVDVGIRYQDWKHSDSVAPFQVTIRAHDSHVLDLTESDRIAADTPFTIDVRTLGDEPIVAERLAFSGRPARRLGSAVIAGSPVAATKWLVAQGGPTKSHTSVVSVANPGTSAAHLRVVQLTQATRRRLPGGAITVPAGDRVNIPVADAATAATFEISSDQPIVVAYALSNADGVGLALGNAEPFPDTIVVLPESPSPD